MSANDHDLTRDLEDLPLELAERPPARRPPPGPSDSCDVDDPIFDDLLDDTPAPDPSGGRFGLILASGLVLIGLTFAARAILESAAPLPAQLEMVAERPGAGPVPPPGATVARYEYERARASR